MAKPPSGDTGCVMVTVGHSTRTLETFIQLLQTCEVRQGVDVHTVPGITPVHFPGEQNYPRSTEIGSGERVQGPGDPFLQLRENIGGRLINELKAPEETRLVCNLDL